jgi:hypothetical protein
MGPSRFTSHPKKGVLRIFMAIKSPSPCLGLNPRLLVEVASTLTTTPPRRLSKDTADALSSGIRSLLRADTALQVA